MLPDPSLPAQGPGRAPNGNFVLNEFKVGAKAEGAAGDFKPVALHNAQADFSQDACAVAGAIDGNPATGWAISPQFGKPHTAVFEIKDAARLPQRRGADDHAGSRSSPARTTTSASSACR